MTDPTIAAITDVLHREAAAIEQLAQRASESWTQAVDLLEACTGRLVLTGMGKSGAIARKAAATFCSTGAPAVFLHSAEAVHGDLGIIAESDVVIALSNSGETSEIIQWLPFLQRHDNRLISLTGNLTSTLATNSQVVIDTHVDAEADPLELAPTNSTTVMLAMCDALAVALMQRRGFTRDQFAIFHPGGNLGRKLLLRVSDLMRAGNNIPTVPAATSFQTAIQTINDKKLGCVMVVDETNRLQGIVTDGDLRRHFVAGGTSLEIPVDEVMSRDPRSIAADALAAEALRVMEDHEISVLPVVDERQHLAGVLHLHDLIRAGLA